MNTKILVTIVALAILIPVGGTLLLSDDGGAVSGEFVIVDDRGKVFKFDESPERIASLGKPFTNILIEIGAADKIVAVDSWSEDFIDDYPEVDLANLSVGGSIFGLDVEKVANKNPDLVITYAYTWSSVQTRIAAIEALGIPVIAFYPQGYGDVVKLVEEMGKVSGQNTEALAAINDMADTVIEVQNAVAKLSDSEKPHVYFEMGTNEKTVNIGTLSDWLIVTAGGINVAQNASAPSTYKPHVETVWDWDVQIIVVEDKHPTTNVDLMGQYKNPDAENDPEVYRLSHGYNTYDLNLVKGLKQMAEFLHPELFDFS